MSTFVVDELRAITLVQPVRILTPITVGSIKAIFYVHNLPLGMFTATLKKGLETILSWSFDSTTLQNSFDGIEPHFAVVYPLYKSSAFRLGTGDYTLELSSVGYTYHASSWIGWCKDWQGPMQKTYGPGLEEFRNFPYSHRIIEYRESK